MSNSLVEEYTVAIVKFFAASKAMLLNLSVGAALLAYEMFTNIPDNIKYPIGVLICSYVSIAIFKRFIYLATKKESHKTVGAYVLSGNESLKMQLKRKVEAEKGGEL
ncbi:hypothetical protein [Klebsiella pneumoniae]|uniref:hypothetical protein n=1 Tax=Klebsiella pneumoniae TaxID=573 RepID=UPI0027F0AB81|nr:hypothetical protein [Salmonella enterica subsp. enterica serovar Kentucky]EJE9671383.1 hypothetical protein [Salmonella enterica]EKB1060835.1 hypothetical protein [Salmonella enterica subsp. enterica serovar Infantis]ELT2524739.1 hypothetical protein [Salmonella enterica subsp. enterica serovar Schwarzengrund]HDU1613163.1 hypothetical protein [Klebsiella pneumoniae]